MDESKKTLASYITFRELFNNNTSEVFKILERFVISLIKSRKLRSFKLGQIVYLLKNEFEFNLPESVVKSVIRQVEGIKLTNHIYYVEDSFYELNEDHFSEVYRDALKLNEEVLDLLVRYIAEFEERVDEKNIIQAFCDFILNENKENKYAKYISAFILKYEASPSVKKYISLISEGCILYTGLNFNGVNTTTWTEPIYIYFEQEILFYLYGLNGEIYQKIVLDLISLIKEMNTRSKNLIIKMCYFKDTEESIEKYFDTALSIFNRGGLASLEQTAMQSIITDCKSPSDIIEKKSDFFKYLKSNGILVQADYNYFSEDNNQYNLLDINDAESEEPNIIRYKAHLNYINILRKNIHYEDLKKCKHILLTETKKIIELDKEFGEFGINSKTRLAINISLLTNRLWYDLNKGFGGGDIPSSLDVWIKSKVILSTELSNSVHEQYRTLSSKIKNGEVDENDLSRYISEFRQKNKLPDFISGTNADEILKQIKERDIEDIQKSLVAEAKEREKLKENQLKQEKELVEKKLTINRLDKKLKESDNDYKDLQKNFISELKENKRKILKEYIRIKTCRNYTRKILYYFIWGIGFLIVIFLIYIIYKYAHSLKIYFEIEDINFLKWLLAPITPIIIYKFIRSRGLKYSCFISNLIYNKSLRKYDKKLKLISTKLLQITNKRGKDDNR